MSLIGLMTAGWFRFDPRLAVADGHRGASGRCIIRG
jgi:hypothetical protein